MVSDSVITEYTFDTKNRLIRVERSYPYISFFNPGHEIIATDTTIIEYKYTTNGYERYENGVKRESFAFQQDSYCTEIINYLEYRDVLDGKKADPNEMRNFYSSFLKKKNYISTKQFIFATES